MDKVVRDEVKDGARADEIVDYLFAEARQLRGRICQRAQSRSRSSGRRFSTTSVKATRHWNLLYDIAGRIRQRVRCQDRQDSAQMGGQGQKPSRVRRSLACLRRPWSSKQRGRVALPGRHTAKLGAVTIAFFLAFVLWIIVGCITSTDKYAGLYTRRR